VADLFLHGLGHFHPEVELSNAFLEELDIGTSDEWILERTGIRSRRTVLPLDYIRQTRNREPRAALEAALHSNADMGRAAAEMALERAGIEASEIGMVIAGSSATDTASPAEACNVAAALGLEVPAFDVNSACTSFYVQLFLLARMQPEALPDYVLLVAPESLTKTVDYSDRSAAVLWGDAAVAAVVSSRHASRARVKGSTLASSPAGGKFVMVPRMGHFQQEGRTVQLFGIRRMARLVGALREEFEDERRTFHFVGHQANLRMLESVCTQCGIPDERHHSNVEWYGNTGCASAAAVVSMLWDKWTGLDDIAVAGVGSGLTWSSYLLRFGDRP
jgi:3-oxoacyl-[acyl-carrier-protein] synthase-3